MKAKVLQQHFPHNLCAVLFDFLFCFGVCWVFFERIIACSKSIYINYINWDLVLKL